MWEMEKDFFQVVEKGGIKYVVKQDELQKNHGCFEREKFSAFMPEVKGMNGRI